MTLDENSKIKSILELDIKEAEANYAVGDIHGCFEELQLLESKIKASVKRRRLNGLHIISIGDLCDRGPDAASVFEHFANGAQQGTHKLILGNHETFFMLSLIGLRPDLIAKSGAKLTWYHKVLMRVCSKIMLHTNQWRINGGDRVFSSYESDIDKLDTWDKIPDSHIRLMFGAPLVIKSAKVILSHALLHPGDLDIFMAMDNGEEIDADLVDRAVMRCLWERELPSQPIESGKKHISGHTPMMMVARDSVSSCIQIDTGAVYGQSLTAIDLSNFRTIAIPSGFSCKAVAK